MNVAVPWQLFVISVFAWSRLAGATCGAESARAVGTLATESLSEVSGAAYSPTHDLLWLHNDGTSATLWATHADGTIEGQVGLSGATFEDWEDLALGPCPDSSGEGSCSCLFAADIGDNALERGGGVVWRVAEPDPFGEDEVVTAEGLWFDYPSGPEDAEALVVDPRNGAVLIIGRAREDGITRVYSFPDVPPEPNDRDTPVTLIEVASVDLKDMGARDHEVLAADASPGGAKLALRTREDLLIFDASGGAALWDAFNQEPEVLDVPAQSGHGEALAWGPDGASLFLLAEGSRTIYQQACEDADGGSALSACTARKCGCSAAPAGGLLVPGLGLLGLGLVGLRRRASPQAGQQEQEQRRA